MVCTMLFSRNTDANYAERVSACLPNFLSRSSRVSDKAGTGCEYRVQHNYTFHYTLPTLQFASNSETGTV